MKYIKLFEEFCAALFEGYSEKLIAELSDRLSKSGGVSADLVKKYILDFQIIKDTPHVTEKDIMKYDWKTLETVVDSRPVKKLKAGKITVDGGDEIYDDEDMTVYVGTTKELCIKYGNGYSWCISARGDDNMYPHYRILKQGTPYFVRYKKLSSQMTDGKIFDDPWHAVVIFHYPDGSYTITNAANKGQEVYADLEAMIADFKQLTPIKDLLIHVPVSVKERKMDQLITDYQTNFPTGRAAEYKKLKFGYLIEFIGLDKLTKFKACHDNQLEAYYTEVKGHYDLTGVMFCKGEPTKEQLRQHGEDLIKEIRGEEKLKANAVINYQRVLDKQVKIIYDYMLETAIKMNKINAL